MFVMPMEAGAASADSRAGMVTTGGGRLNVRSGSSTGSALVTQLANGSYVTLISKSGSWWKVEYGKGLYGYCHTDYIREVSAATATVKTQSGNLNVRSGPGTGYGKTGSLAKGETVVVLSASGQWSRILYQGTRTGYVSSQYLSNFYGAVSLNVPNFKQNDTRWANETIGTSGKTFARIGCATTAVAMLESYRQGKVIYPNVMSRSLRYTSSGDLYWPADYSVVTVSTGYMSKLYTLLRQGKPVLFGARNAYGTQHWVVVTGFTGGSSLTPAGFTIQDPGTWSRTTLQQFLEAYPTFYKFFHY